MIRRILYQLAWLFMITGGLAISAGGQQLAVSMHDKAIPVSSRQGSLSKPIKTVLEEFEVQHQVSIVYQSDLIDNKTVMVKRVESGNTMKDLPELFKQHNLFLRQSSKDLDIVEQACLPSKESSNSLAERLRV